MTELKKNLINIIGISVAAVLTTWTVTVVYKKLKRNPDKKGLSIKKDNEVKAPLVVTDTPEPEVKEEKTPDPIIEVKKVPEPVQEVFNQTSQKVLNTSVNKAQELQDSVIFKDEDDFTVVKKDDLTDSYHVNNEQKDSKNISNTNQRDIIVKVNEDDDEEEDEESETSSRDSRSSSISEEEEVPQVTFKPFVKH
ncbi:unnamed protein product [Diamesa serratosioi]